MIGDPKKSYENLRKKVASIGWIAAVSLMNLYKTCGKASCACTTDESARHGPYRVWTRKVEGKTVTRTLSKKQASECKRAIENMRKLEQLVEQMKQVSAEGIENLESDALS